MPEPSRIAGVMPTRRLSCAAISHSHWPNTWVKVGLAGVAGLDDADLRDQTCPGRGR